MSTGAPFSRMLREGGSPKPGSWAALEDALDEMFAPIDNNELDETTNQETR